MRAVVGTADLHQWLPCRAARTGLLDLMGRQLGPASKPDATRHGVLAPLVCASPDQFPLELGKAAEHRQHEPPMSGGGVGPSIGYGPEAGALLRNCGEHIQQAASAAGKPVEACDQQHVATAKRHDCAL